MVLDWKTFSLDEWDSFNDPQWETFVLDPTAQGLLYRVSQAQLYCYGANQAEVIASFTEADTYTPGADECDIFTFRGRSQVFIPNTQKEQINA